MEYLPKYLLHYPSRFRVRTNYLLRCSVGLTFHIIHASRNTNFFVVEQTLCRKFLYFWSDFASFPFLGDFQIWFSITAFNMQKATVSARTKCINQIQRNKWNMYISPKSNQTLCHILQIFINTDNSMGAQQISTQNIFYLLNCSQTCVYHVFLWHSSSLYGWLLSE